MRINLHFWASLGFMIIFRSFFFWISTIFLWLSLDKFLLEMNVGLRRFPTVNEKLKFQWKVHDIKRKKTDSNEILRLFSKKGRRNPSRIKEISFCLSRTICILYESCNDVHIFTFMSGILHNTFPLMQSNRMMFLNWLNNRLTNNNYYVVIACLLRLFLFYAQNFHHSKNIGQLKAIPILDNWTASEKKKTRTSPMNRIRGCVCNDA